MSKSLMRVLLHKIFCKEGKFSDKRNTFSLLICCLIILVGPQSAYCSEKLKYAVICKDKPIIIAPQKRDNNQMWTTFRRLLVFELNKKLALDNQIEIIPSVSVNKFEADFESDKKNSDSFADYLIEQKIADVVLDLDSIYLTFKNDDSFPISRTFYRLRFFPKIELEPKLNYRQKIRLVTSEQLPTVDITCNQPYITYKFDVDRRQSEQIIANEQISLVNEFVQKITTNVTATMASISVHTLPQEIAISKTVDIPQPVASQKPKLINKSIGDKWALVIGISKFANPTYNLKYAAKDAQDFYNYLVTDGKFKRDHVVLLLNEKATRRNIMAAFGDKFLPAVAREGDLVAIYVSTHGTPSAKDPGKRNFLVAHDTEADALYETGIDMDELSRRIREGVQTDRALIVLDTCYSGAGVPGSRAIGDVANFDAKQIAQGFGHLVISSSSPTERSWESKSSQNGVFTKYFIQNLKKYNGNVKNAYEKLSEDVDWEVKSTYNQKQHPQLGGNWEGEEMIFSAPASSPRTVLNPELIKLMNLQQPAASAPKATTKN